MYNKHKGIAVGFDDWGPTQTSYHIQSTHIKGVLFDVVYKSPENGAAKARRKLSTVLPAEKRPSGKKKAFLASTRGFSPQTMVSAHHLSGTHHHPPVLSYLPNRRKRQSVVHRWVQVAEVRRVGPITDDGGDGRLVYSGLIFVSDFYTGGVAAEADNCILLEIMIIVISFNDADLLYYLLFDAFARRLRVWCTMVAVERCWKTKESSYLENST